MENSPTSLAGSLRASLASPLTSLLRAVTSRWSRAEPPSPPPPPGRAMQEVLTPELLARIKAIQLRTRHLVTDVLAGEYESAFKGRGMEFDEVREYHPGDDVRHIEWNITARMNAPFVKVHKEERELTVMLLVDASSSGAFGTVDRLKSEVAAEVAAILAYTAVRSHDRVGLIVFTDRVERYIPAKKGSSHIWRVIREILSFRAERQATDLPAALDFLGKVSRRRTVAFLISDFLDLAEAQTGARPGRASVPSVESPTVSSLRIAARRHDLTAVTITDPRELVLPGLGLIELEDAETGELIAVDTWDHRLTEGFRQLGIQERRDRHDLFRAAGIGAIDIRTDESAVEPIVRFFRGRHAWH